MPLLFSVVAIVGLLPGLSRMSTMHVVYVLVFMIFQMGQPFVFSSNRRLIKFKGTISWVFFKFSILSPLCLKQALK